MAISVALSAVAAIGPSSRKAFSAPGGEIVTKDTLLGALWPGVQVNEEVLTVHVRALRKVLEDDARSPRFIETVHGREYHFVAAVTAAPVPSSEF